MSRLVMRARMHELLLADHAFSPRQPAALMIARAAALAAAGAWIVDFSQGVGLRTLYTEMQTGIQTTHPPPPTRILWS